MKIFSLRVLTLTFLLGAASLCGARAEDSYKVISVHPFFSKEVIKVGNEWRNDSQRRLQVSLQPAADTPASSIYVKAYFYDKDDHLVSTSPAPNPIWTSTGHGTGELGLPATLPKGKLTTVYFALPPDLQAKNWTTVLIVFGDATKAAALAMPGSELPKLDYPEKSRVAPAS